MIIVTGGAGFIGSAFVWKLNTLGLDDILVVDDLGRGDKWKNLVNLRFADYMRKDAFAAYLDAGADPFGTSAVVHMGACSSTTEDDAEYLMANNYGYSKKVCERCLTWGARLINASSAATYGDGSLGFDDDPDTAPRLKPLNMYGFSKQLFDRWALSRGVMDRIASLKFFNVFGPNEYHKGDMKSVVCKAYAQIRETGRLRLFKSRRDDYPDGGQKRDFVYVKDVVDVMAWLLERPDVCGLFNVGSGRAETWNALAAAVFAAMDLPEHIEYVDMPETIREKYQYYTKAETSRLRRAGWDRAARPLAEAAADYVKNHLATADPYLAP